MDDHEPQLSSYRQKQALQAYEEAQETMNPQSVQITDAVISYLQSGEFIALFVLLLTYRAVLYFFNCLPRLMQQYFEAKERLAKP